MSPRLLPSAALLFAGSCLLPLPAEAVSCPNYINILDPDKCNQDGFCGWFDMGALTIQDGNLEEDDPPPESGTLQEPFSEMRDAMQGSGDLFGIADSEMDAGRSVVAASGTARFEAPCCDFPPSSGNAEGRALAVMRVTDLVLSGPGPEVETSVSLVFDGTLTQISSNRVDGLSVSTMTSRAFANLGGSICNGEEYLGFKGNRTYTLLDQSPEGDPLFVDTPSGVMIDVPLDGVTEIVVGPFTLPTGVPLQLELWLETFVLANGNGGNARTTADFVLSLGALADGSVFDLPPGYTANSPTAGIVANQVPEPSATGLASIAILAVLRLARRRRRHAMGAPRR